MTGHDDQAWLDREGWKNGAIHSSAGTTWKFLVVFAVFWNLIGFGAAIAVMSDHPPAFPDPVYLILLFPAIGLLVIWQAIKHVLEWRRHGRLNLTLDPYPGSIGGDVGGYLTLPAMPSKLGDLEATVSCLRISINRSSKGNSRSETVKWRRRANTRVDRAANGSRISFRVQVDPDLPNSEPPTGSHSQWLLRLSSKQAGLDRSFDIPVFDTGRAEESRLHIDATPMTVEQQAFPAEVVRVQRRPDGLELVYPSSRAGAAGWMLTVFGLCFVGAGVFLGYQSVGSMAGRGSFFIGGITGFMCLVFTTVGLLITAFGVYLKSNELRVLIGRDTLTTRRRVGPWSKLRSLPIAAITGVDKSITMQSSQGTETTVYYALKTQGTKPVLTIGDGIRNQPLADGLLALIREELEANGNQSVAPTASSAQPGPKVARSGLYDPERAAKAKPIIKVIKWAGKLIFAILFGLFLLDFLDLWN